MPNLSIATHNCASNISDRPPYRVADLSPHALARLQQVRASSSQFADSLIQSNDPTHVATGRAIQTIKNHLYREFDQFVQPVAPVLQAPPANPPANVQPAPVAQALPAAAPADRELELERLRLEQALAQLERDRMALEQQRLAFEQQRAAIELEKLQLERLRLAQPAPAAPVAQAPTAEPVPLIPAVALPPAEPAPEDSSALATLSTEVAPSYPQTGPHKGLADATP
jgi:hypothetical protein